MQIVIHVPLITCRTMNYRQGFFQKYTKLLFWHWGAKHVERFVKLVLLLKPQVELSLSIKNLINVKYFALFIPILLICFL